MSPTYQRWSRLLVIPVLLLSWFVLVPEETQAQDPDVTYIVDTASDADTSAGGTFCTPNVVGDCSLRQAIELANEHTPGTSIRITFAPALNGTTIEINNPVGVLPPLTVGNTEIQGTSFGAPLNSINGMGKSVGFRLRSDNNTISGLSIYGFSDSGTEPYLGSGIYITGSKNKIIGNFIGVTPESTQPPDELRNFSGVRITGGTGNIIGGTTLNFGEANYISGNVQNGVLVNNANGNFIQGNFIGVVRASLTTVNVLGNGQYGVQVFSSGGTSTGNEIGGTTRNAANIIAGNGRAGVRLAGTNTLTNTVRGNFIGTDNFGNPQPVPLDPDFPDADYRNLGDGVLIEESAKNNIVSGTASAPMIISNNNGYGVVLNGLGTNDNEIKSVSIGTNENASMDLGNSKGGVWITNGASNNLISGTSSEHMLIVGSRGDAQEPGNGVTIDGVRTANNRISGVYIGAVPNPVATNGTVPLPNAGDGIFVQNAPLTQITQGNLISGNAGYGIRATNALSTTITGNTLGLDVVSTASVPNTGGGIALLSTESTLIGGLDTTTRNIISGNSGPGISIAATDTLSTTIIGNIIGLRKNSTGTSGTFIVEAPNGSDGIKATGGEIMRIGGPTTEESNLIAANTGSGINLSNVVSTTIQSNQIGGISSGDTIQSLGNNGDGLFVSDSMTVTVASNLFYDSGSNGIVLSDTLTGTVQTNAIINNVGNGIEVMDNSDNILIDNNSIYTNTIGVLVSGEPPNAPQQVSILDNSISRNRTAGIDLDPSLPLTQSDEGNPNHDIDPPIVDPTELNLPPEWRMGISNSGLLSGYVITDTSSVPPFNPAACVTCTVQIFKPDPELAVADGQGFAKAAPDANPDETGYFEVQLFDIATAGIPDQVLLTATDFAGNTSEYALFTVSRAVEIVPPRTEPSPVFPGQVFSYTHTVANIGSVNDSFRLSASSSLSWTYSIEPAEPFNLRAGESRPVTVTVTVPPGGDPNAAVDLPHTLTVTATSTTDQDVNASVQDTTTVGGNRKITFDPLTSAGLTQPGQEINYVHTVRNEGNLTATINLDFDTTQPSWTTALNKPTMTLGPGGVDQIRLSVTPPDQVIIAGTTSVVEIEASVVEDANQDQVLTDTTEIVLEPQAILVPDRQGFAAAGETITFRHTATNRSNGQATFKIEGASSLGSEIRFESDTEIQLVDGNTFTVGFAEGNDFFNFLVHVTVNPRARENAEDTVTIFLTDEEGRRLGGATVQDTIRITEGFFLVHLPIVAR